MTDTKRSERWIVTDGETGLTVGPFMTWKEANEFCKRNEPVEYGYVFHRYTIAPSVAVDADDGGG